MGARTALPQAARALAGAAVWLLVAAAPAGAALPTGNLLGNPGFEAGPGATNSSDDVEPPAWSTPGRATAVQYGTPGGFPTTEDSASLGGGTNLFAGGPDDGTDLTGAIQTVALDSERVDIQSNRVQMTVSGCLGGYADQNDYVQVFWNFAKANGESVGISGSLLGPNAAERGNTTRLVPRAETVNVPPEAETVSVLLFAFRTSGPNTYNDGYADNLSLTLAATGTTPPRASCSVAVPPAPSTPAPAPPPPPSPDPPPLTVTVSSLRVWPGTFRAATRGASIARAPAVPTGARVGYTLPVARPIAFSVARVLPGVLRGRNCVRRLPGRRGRACARVNRLRGGFARLSGAGANSFRFTGRLAGRKLPPGRYRLLATVPASGGIPARTTSAPFRIVP